MSYEDDSIPASDTLPDHPLHPGDENSSAAQKTKVYVKKDIKYEDVKSTAYTFITIGIIGIIFLVLLAFNIVPLAMAAYMKTLMILVMGTLFLVFLIIGIRYFKKLSSMKTEILEEETLSKDISDWFFANYTSDKIDSQIADLPKEDERLYFARYEIMMHALRGQFPAVDESFADHMIEEIYEKIFIEK